QELAISGGKCRQPTRAPRPCPSLAGSRPAPRTHADMDPQTSALRRQAAPTWSQHPGPKCAKVQTFLEHGTNRITALAMSMSDGASVAESSVHPLGDVVRREKLPPG